MKTKLLVITCILSLFIAFTNSYDARETEELSYAIAIGLDLSDSPEEPLALTLQIAKPDSSGDSSGTKITTEAKTVTCSSFSLGMAMLNLENINEINLSHCTAIIISEELAKQGIEDFINTLANDVEIRPTCNILISEGKASELLQKASSIDDISAKFYNSFINSAKITSYVSTCPLTDFYSSLHGDIKAPTAIYTFTKDDTIESIGLAVFKDYKMVGRLSGLDTFCFNILTNEFQEATIEVYNPQEPDIPLSINLSNSKDKTRTKVTLENGVPKITCEIFLKSSILSANENYNYSTEESKREVEAEINKFIENACLDFLNRTSKEYQSDIIGFQGQFNKNYLTQDELDKHNWNKLYPKAKFEIKPTNYLISGFLFSKD